MIPGYSYPKYHSGFRGFQLGGLEVWKFGCDAAKKNALFSVGHLGFFCINEARYLASHILGYRSSRLPRVECSHREYSVRGGGAHELPLPPDQRLSRKAWRSVALVRVGRRPLQHFSTSPNFLVTNEGERQEPQGSGKRQQLLSLLTYHCAPYR